MTAYSRHGRLLEERIEERIAELGQQIVTVPAADYATYRQIVGRVEGLADALKISQEIDGENNGG
jgi:hypothetical protein